ncbi:melibiase [Frondihabitans sp. PhB188]|uniref:alpha-galactosidase n=1 Tax=Frondihabitans sp. PhB188 TaxID=2485200 RepID=UPI000F479C49|nr:alpha-galactosidase [Frondihabitans sp. PhB188]ROQ41621.1 melibiase [Frondihabitans sp. PhB188]
MTLAPERTSGRLDSVTIEFGNDDLEIVLRQDPGEALRVLRLGRRGSAADAPSGQPAVEVVTVDSGHAPSTSRLTLGDVSARLRYASHVEEVDERGWRSLVVTLEEDGLAGGLSAFLRLSLPSTGLAVRSTVRLENAAGAGTRVVRSVASLALRVGLGDAAVSSPDDLLLASAASDWIGEARWSRKPLREAGLADLRLAEHRTGSRGAIVAASEGTWSTSRALPTGVLEAGSGGALAWQIEHNGGWRWDIAEDEQGTSLALSGPTDADHQWLGVLAAGESLETVPATVAAGDDLEGAIAALTDFRRAARRPHPDDAALGVVFNDYMNTLMGDPTTEKLLPLIDAAAETGVEYFVIDCGWYDDDSGWWFSVGDWQPSTVRFPGGLDRVIAHIRDRGMTPGLWLEPEVVGVTSRAADTLPADAFLQRHGVRIVEHGRYHLDFRHPAVVAHLDEAVDRLVTEFGVGYFKLDYNINPGAGTDVAATSPGAALLDHNRAHLAWLESVLDRHPGLVLENCGSGAMRMDQAMLQRLQLQSTSDQQEPEAYPPIAAAAPLMMLPEQAANWAYPQPGMGDEALAFTLCTALLGRFYLSGHVDTMSIAQTTLVAEAVAAHKRIRADLAVGHASWPLGIDQWDAPWVALAIGSADARYLTLWRRAGSVATIEVPLPDLRGRELFVDTVFPARLDPWQTEWDAAAGILRVRATGGEVAARTFRLTTERPAVTVVVDATQTGSDVHGGAAGMLYGLGEPGVPSRALVEGVKPRTMAQKAPGGAQHPGGDAAVLADGYFAAGGEEMVVYLQDALREWPYEQLGIDAYADLVRDLVGRVADRRRFTWVPFNEGDWIWYSDWSEAGRARFLADWATVYRAIREVDPGARIAGPNESQYFPARVTDFLEFARDEGVLPDVMSWHELSPSSLERYPAHFAHYRALERRLGVGPLPINIDEYGNKRDMSNPGQLIQWLALFEGTGVDADLAYWTMAGNLDDHAVGTNQANGGWWLLHWYASLRGRTVGVTLPHAGVRDSVSALAAVDADSLVLRVIVGGTADEVDLELRGVDWAGESARVTVSRTTWTGYEGDAGTPPVILTAETPVTSGRASVRLPGGDPQAAYLVVVTPAGPGADPDPAPWSTAVGVESARIVQAPLRRHGDDPQEYTGAGRYAVAGLPHAASSVEFDVAVPEAGEYLLGLVYGTDARPGLVELLVDGVSLGGIELPATLSRFYFGRADVPVELAEGSHRVMARRRADDESGAGDVAIDGLRLARATTGGTQRRGALDAWLDEGAELVHDREGALTGPIAVRVGPSSCARFFVAVAHRGAHRISVATSAGTPRLAVDGRPVPLDSHGSATVALPLGLSVVTVGAADAAVVEHVDVTASSTPPLAVWDLGAGAEHSLPLDASISPAGGGRAGEYLLTIEFANADRATGHLYNADVITRFLELSAGDAVQRVPFRFTSSWESPREISVPVTIGVGVTELRLGAVDGAPGPRLVRATLDAFTTGVAVVGS